MIRKWIVFALCLAGLATAVPAGAADAPKAASANTTQVLMRQKLESVHGLFEAVLKRDFAGASIFAERLAEIARAASWHKSTDETYLGNARSFRNSAEAIVDAAKAKSLEGLTLGYVRVTLDCMRCHEATGGGPKR